MRQTGYIPGFSRGSIRINAYSRNTFDLIGQLRDWMRVGGDRILGIRGIGGVFWKKKLHRCEKDICSKPGWTFQRSNVLTVLAFLRLTFIKRSSVLERLKRKAVRYGMRLNYSGRRNGLIPFPWFIKIRYHAAESRFDLFSWPKEGWFLWSILLGDEKENHFLKIIRRTIDS